MTNLKLQFLIFLISFCFQEAAISSITTSKSVDVSQSFGSEEIASIDRNINITTITPNFTLDYNKSKLDVSLDYSLITNINNTDSDRKTNHSLALITNYAHIPEEWTTTYSTRVFQQTVSDSNQLIGNSIITTDDSNEYIVNTLSTSRNYSINNDINFNSLLNISSQGLTGSSLDKNLQYTFGFNINQITPRISLETSYSSNKNYTSNETTSSLNITNLYTFNNKLDGFIRITDNQSNNSSFDETRYSIGINWEISELNFLIFDIGKFGDTDSWTTNLSINYPRTSISFIHSEEISPANQLIVDNLNNQNSTITNSTDSSLAYIKNSTIQLNHRLNRLTTGLSFSKVNEFNDLESSANRTSNDQNLSLLYALDRRTTLSYEYTRSSVLSTISNSKLKQHTVIWSSTLNRKSSYSVTLNSLTRLSNVVISNSDIKQIDLNYNITF